MLLCYGRQSRVKHCITVLLNDLGSLTLYIFNWYKVKAWEYKGKGKWKPSQREKTGLRDTKEAGWATVPRLRGCYHPTWKETECKLHTQTGSLPRGQGWPICQWVDGEEKEIGNQSTNHKATDFFFESTKLPLLQVTFNDMTLQQFQDKQFILQEAYEVWDPLMAKGTIP